MFMLHFLNTKNGTKSAVQNCIEMDAFSLNSRLMYEVAVRGPT